MPVSNELAQDVLQTQSVVGDEEKSAKRLRIQYTQPWLMNVTLIVSDAATLLFAMLVSIFVVTWGLGVNVGYLGLPLLVLCAVFLVIFGAYKQYANTPFSPVYELRALVSVISLIFGGVIVSTFLFGGGDVYARLVLVLSWLVAVVLLPSLRTLLRMIYAGTSWWGYPAVIYGCGECAEMVAHTLIRHPDIGLKPAAFVRVGDECGVDELLGLPVVDSLKEIDDARKMKRQCFCMIALPDIPKKMHKKVSKKVERQFHSASIIPDITGLSSMWASAADFEGIQFLQVRHRLLDRGRRTLKYMIDIALIAAVAPVLLPLFAVICVLIKLDSRGAILFKQVRVGKHGKRFEMIKFRTMRTNADELLQVYLEQNPERMKEWQLTHKLKNDPRITRVGYFLRKTSLDELPQLINVLRGEMAIVGPRPIFDADMQFYGEDINIYTQVRPGITGMWQISGRNQLTYDERVRMDLYYIRNWSVWFDVFILSRTVFVVLLCRGAY